MPIGAKVQFQALESASKYCVNFGVCGRPRSTEWRSNKRRATSAAIRVQVPRSMFRAGVDADGQPTEWWAQTDGSERLGHVPHC